MIPLVGVEPRASDFQPLHVTVWVNSLFAGSLRPLDPYIIMLYWFLDSENFLESIKQDCIRILRSEASSK